MTVGARASSARAAAGSVSPGGLEEGRGTGPGTEIGRRRLALGFGAAVLLLLVAFGLRLYRIDDHNVWWDEGFEVYLARLSLVEMAVRTAADVHPPAHYGFLHFWDRLVGESEYAIRYSSALFGVLDLALLYWLARRYLGIASALGALALVGVNRLHVEWSQEIRMYTLAIALVLLSTAIFLRLARDGDGRLRWWVGHGAVSVLGLYTLYFFGLAPLIQSLLVLLGTVVPIDGRRLSVRFALRWALVQACVLALFVPWLLVFLSQPRPAPVPIFPVDFVTWLRAVFTALPVGISAYLDQWSHVTLGATLLLLLPLLLARRSGRGWIYLAGYVPLVLGPLVIYAMSYPNPVLYSPNLFVRYMILFLPLYAMLVAHGIVLLAGRSRAVAAVVGVVAVATCLWTLQDLYASRYRRDEYRTIASYIASYAEPGDAVVLYSDFDWPVFAYYARDSLPRYGVGTLAKQTPESAGRIGAEWLGRHHSLWLVTLANAYDADPDGHLRRWLEGSARTVSDFSVADKRLTLFSIDPGRSTARPVANPPSHTVAAPTSLAPRPIGADVPVEEIQAGDVLHLATYWRGNGPPDAAYHLELVGPDGTVLRRTGDGLRSDWPSSAWPPDATARVDRELPLPDRAPAGRYEIRLGVGTSTGTTWLPSPIARLTVLPPARPPKAPLPPPDPALPQRADRFGERIELVGAVPPGAALAAGGQLPVTLLWQAIRSMEEPYTAFVQVVGTTNNPATGNPVWAQIDAPPSRESPTNLWLPGDLALDERTLALPSNLPNGQYELIVGLYDQRDGRRLALPDGADHVVLRAWTLHG